MISEDQLGVHSIKTNGRNGSTRTQSVNVINEAGLYKMIMRSEVGWVVERRSESHSGALRGCLLGQAAAYSFKAPERR